MIDTTVLGTTFGERLQWLINARGLSQREVARLSGLNGSSVNQWCTGAKPPPNQKSLSKLAQVLKTTPGTLLGESVLEAIPPKPFKELLKELEETVARMGVVAIPVKGIIVDGSAIELVNSEDYIELTKKELRDVTNTEKILAVQVSTGLFASEGINVGDRIVVDGADTNIVDGEMYYINLRKRDLFFRIFHAEGDTLQLVNTKQEEVVVPASAVTVVGKAIMAYRPVKYLTAKK